MDQITIGRIVIYTLNERDAERINRRRADEQTHRATREHDGAIVHVGNPVAAGDQFPLLVTRVWDNGLINGQVQLDGNDTYWATSATIGDPTEPGTWSWPTRR